MDDTTKTEIKRLIASMDHLAGGTTSDTIQRPMMARIQFLIAVDQAESAQKLERQTSALIKFTRGLFYLTCSLVVFTAALLIFTIALVVRH